MAGKFDGILICTDFDNTLAFAETVSPENREAIRYFQENGGLFAPVSGRPSRFFLRHLEQFRPNTFVAGLNGTIIEDIFSGERIFEAPLGDEALATAAACVARYSTIHLIGFQGAATSTEIEKPADGWDFTKTPIVSPFYKIMLVLDDPEQSDAVYNGLTERFGDRYEVARSWLTGVELQAKGVDKGTAIRELRRYYGERIKTVIGFGDYENDIPLLRAADIAVAEENALPCVKAVADRVTGSCKTDSLARIIMEL